MIALRRTIVLLLVAAWLAPARAADVDIAITGLVTHPGSLSLAKVKALPPQTLSVTFHTGRGEQKGVYTGGALWDVLQAAQIVDQGKNSLLRRSVTIKARDGYTVLLSAAELDPDYGNAGAILAYERDGKPIGEGLRLVFPRDRHGGRAVNDVTSIDVR